MCRVPQQNLGHRGAWPVGYGLCVIGALEEVPRLDGGGEERGTSTAGFKTFLNTL